MSRIPLRVTHLKDLVDSLVEEGKGHKKIILHISSGDEKGGWRKVTEPNVDYDYSTSDTVHLSIYGDKEKDDG